MNNLSDFNNSELISLYGELVSELKKRNIIRTKNVVGDLGERFAIDHFSKTNGLENLIDAPTSTKSIDAVSDSGKRYAIKSVTGNLTGVFYGLPHKDSDDEPEQLFDYLLIVIFNDSYKVNTILELTWQQFLKHKKWHSRMEAWNISINKQVKSESNIIYGIIS
ncbi:MAG: hypothetical protein ACPGR2_12860 [Psychrobium sp.]